MRLLKLAVETKRWDLAAHTIVLAAARVVTRGEESYVNRENRKKRRPKGQSKR